MEIDEEDLQREGAATHLEYLRGGVSQKYIPSIAKDRKGDEFLRLVKGSMSVAQYEAKFTQLPRYGPQYISAKKDKAKPFQKGLTPLIQQHVATLMMSGMVNWSVELWLSRRLWVCLLQTW